MGLGLDSSVGSIRLTYHEYVYIYIYICICIMICMSKPSRGIVRIVRIRFGFRVSSSTLLAWRTPHHTTPHRTTPHHTTPPTPTPTPTPTRHTHTKHTHTHLHTGSTHTTHTHTRSMYHIHASTFQAQSLQTQTPALVTDLPIISRTFAPESLAYIGVEGSEFFRV